MKTFCCFLQHAIPLFYSSTSTTKTRLTSGPTATSCPSLSSAGNCCQSVAWRGNFCSEQCYSPDLVRHCADNDNVRCSFCFSLDGNVTSDCTMRVVCIYYSQLLESRTVNLTPRKQASLHTLTTLTTPAQMTFRQRWLPRLLLRPQLKCTPPWTNLVKSPVLLLRLQKVHSGLPRRRLCWFCTLSVQIFSSSKQQRRWRWTGVYLWRKVSRRRLPQIPEHTEARCGTVWPMSWRTRRLLQFLCWVEDFISHLKKCCIFWIPADKSHTFSALNLWNFPLTERRGSFLRLFLLSFSGDYFYFHAMFLSYLSHGPFSAFSESSQFDMSQVHFVN